MSVSNDEWIDYLDVRGCDAWFEANGDVMMGVGGEAGDGDGDGDVVEMGGLMASWVGGVGCEGWKGEEASG